MSIRAPKPGTLGRETVAQAVRASEGYIAAHLPQIIAVLVRAAEGGDLRAAIYLCDRLLPRPSEPTDAAPELTVVVDL